MTIFDASFLGSADAIGDPYARYPALQGKRAPFQFALPQDAGFAWGLVSHADVQAALRNPQVFACLPSEVSLQPMARRLFAPQRAPALRPWLVAAVERRIAPCPNEIDAMADLAMPLSLQCLAHLLGVQEHEAARLPEGGAPDSAAQLTAFLRRLSNDRRNAPRDDVLSTLVQGSDNVLQEQEIAQRLCALMLESQRVQAFMLGNTLRAVAQRPQIWASLQQDSGEGVPAVVEESLRFAPALQRLQRITTTDVALGAALLPAHSRVHLFMGAACRDPQIWPNAEQFRLDRPSRAAALFAADIHPGWDLPLARVLGESTLRALVRHNLHLNLGAQAPTAQTTAPLLLGDCQLPLRCNRINAGFAAAP